MLLNDDRHDGRGLPVALVCPEHRLKLVLRLALEAAGYAVLDWSHLPGAVHAGEPGALVVDLDSASLRPSTAIARLGAWGVAPTTPVLFISVYPPERHNGRHAAPTEYLQPPFAPQEFLRRVGRLLARAEARPRPKPAIPCEAAE
jgi:DNA-binding response OmpR family regulator